MLSMLDRAGWPAVVLGPSAAAGRAALPSGWRCVQPAPRAPACCCRVRHRDGRVLAAKVPVVHDLAGSALSLRHEIASHAMLREHPALAPYIVPVLETLILAGPDGQLTVPVLIMP